MENRYLGEERYLIESAVGAGGMGTVYRGHHSILDIPIAIKTIHPHLSSDPAFRERFLREARSMARLSHPNIVRVLDADVEDDIQFLVTEWVDGRPLSSLIREKTYSSAEALHLALGLLDALAAANEAGLIHRDIKPTNIMIRPGGEPAVLDFGLARIKGEGNLTMTGSTLGTPEYMSPEQVEGRKIDHRTDLYSLGILLYEAVTGHVPFGGTTPVSIGIMQARELPRPLFEAAPSVHPGLAVFVHRLLEKSPDDRYPNAAAASEALLEEMSGVEPIPRLPGNPVPGPGPDGDSVTIAGARTEARADAHDGEAPAAGGASPPTTTATHGSSRQAMPGSVTSPGDVSPSPNLPPGRPLSFVFFAVTNVIYAVGGLLVWSLLFAMILPNLHGDAFMGGLLVIAAWILVKALLSLLLLLSGVFLLSGRAWGVVISAAWAVLNLGMNLLWHLMMGIGGAGNPVGEQILGHALFAPFLLAYPVVILLFALSALIVRALRRA